MKTKDTLLLAALLVSQIAVAQSSDSDKKNAIAIDEGMVSSRNTEVCLDYYSGKKSVSGTTITYVVEREDRSDINLISYTVYDKNNVLPKVPSLNGVLITSGERPFIPTDESVLESIVRSSVSASKIQTLSHYADRLWVTMRSDPVTGRVLEVEFTIQASTRSKKGPRMISPKELERIEKGIKERIRYDVPDRCKDHSFIVTYCYINFMGGISIAQS